MPSRRDLCLRRSRLSNGARSLTEKQQVWDQEDLVV
jgi:hypothetical protein